MKDAKPELTFRREIKKKSSKGRNHERGRDKEPGQGNSSPSERPPRQACNSGMVSMTKGQHVVLLALHLLLLAPVSPSLSLTHTCPSLNSFLLQHLYKQVVLASATSKPECNLIKICAQLQLPMHNNSCNATQSMQPG